MADLPTNLKDDILDSSVNTRRKYRMIENEDGTYSFEDLTEYNQVGDEYGAGLINETNRQVNARVEKAVVVRDLETIGAITQEGFIPDALALKDVNDSLTADNAQAFQFAYDSESGKYGYKVKEADTDVFVPFKSVEPITISNVFINISNTMTFTVNGYEVVTFGTFRGNSNAKYEVYGDSTLLGTYYRNEIDNVILNVSDYSLLTIKEINARTGTISTITIG